MPAVGRILTRLAELIILILCLPVVALAPAVIRALWFRTYRPAGRRNLFLCQFVNNPQAGAANTEYSYRLYHHGSFARTWTLFAGDAPHRVGRVQRELAAINLSVGFSPQLRRWFPLLTRASLEARRYAAAVTLIHRLRPVSVETVSPAGTELTALLVGLTVPVRLISNVRGNFDLFRLMSTPTPSYRSLRGFLPFLRYAPEKIFYLVFFGRCDLVLGYNNNNADFAICNGAHPAKVRRTRINVHTTILRPKISDDPPADFPLDGRVVLIWSRLGAGKLVQEAVQGVLGALDRRPDLRLVVIGDGAERPKIETDIAASSVADRVHLLGQRDRDYIAAAAARADAAVVPLGGSSLVEAGLFELPVIAYAIEWHGEMITNGETGILVDYPDPQQMADAVVALTDDPEAAKTMGRRLAARVRQTFDADRVAAYERQVIDRFLTNWGA